jgi:SAM-dependent methyltransferase
MPKNDALRWDARYLDLGKNRHVIPRELLNRFHQIIPPSGFVLDVAMGPGGNACFLLNKGYKVFGFDISSVAIRRAKNQCSFLMAAIADSNEISFPANSFDAILNFYFLDRKLLKHYETILKPGGFLFLETPAVGSCEDDFKIERKYLLNKNEIFLTFPRWDILYRNRIIQSNSSKRHKVIEKLILRKV